MNKKPKLPGSLNISNRDFPRKNIPKIIPTPIELVEIVEICVSRDGLIIPKSVLIEMSKIELIEKLQMLLVRIILRKEMEELMNKIRNGDFDKHG